MPVLITLVAAVALGLVYQRVGVARQRRQVTAPGELIRVDGHRYLSRIGVLLAHLGIVRACRALLTGGAPGAPRRFVKVFGPTASATRERLVGEVRKLPADVHPVVQAPTERLEAHRVLATTSTHGRHVIASKGAHRVQFDEPALVVDEIRRLVTTIR